VGIEPTTFSHYDQTLFQLDHLVWDQGVWDELPNMDGLLFRGLRLAIPESLKNFIMIEIYLGQQGVGSYLGHAHKSVYWPGMANDMQEFVYPAM
jgi:hypothetical protein